MDMYGREERTGVGNQPGVAKPREKPAVRTESDTGEGWAVILFNDAVHYREEVVLQVMKALKCSVDRAEGIVTRVERQGQGIVTIANHAEAVRVADVLHEIRLKTELRKMA